MSRRRVLEALVSGTALVVLSPVMAAIALLVRLRLGAPVLFRQHRPGLHGEPFEIIKFRTMRDDRERDGNLLSDDQRMTKFGAMLRSSSLDELPSLINVLRGDMAIVGPRPLLMEYLPMYTTEQARRHAVRPGITGLAQVSGRNELPWAERFALDVYYVEHQSLLLDLRIIGRTVAKVVRREGISATGHTTAPHFTGSAST